ncbi:MAG: TonB-dependent receptor family protein [Gammaproteobacteria bacterium]
MRNRNHGVAIVAAVFCATFTTTHAQQGFDLIGQAREGRSIALPEIRVEERGPAALTSRPIDEAEAELKRVPGGTTLIDAEIIRTRPTGNLEQVLAFAPGVYAQNRFGGDANRLSIRGSGISQDFAIRGVRLLRNGLPITEADGDFHSQLVESLTARYIEVYRGANALQYGASTLGGAINFVTHTGYTAAPLTTRVEAGSHGYLRPQLASGKVIDGHWDYYASLSGSYGDGFRDHAETDSTRFYGNLGYRHGEEAETRLHASVEHSDQQIPGALTKAQLESDPTQASGFFESFNSQNNFNRYRADLQHTLLIGDKDRLDLGAFYETQDIFHPLPFFVRDEDQRNYGLSLRHDLLGHVLSAGNRFIWGGLLALGDVEANDFEPLGGGNRGPLRSTEDSDVLTSELFAENQLRITDRLRLSLGAQLGYSERETDFAFTGSATLDNRIEETYFGVSPKLGLVWQAADRAQLFGNVSRSFEPPILAQFNDTTAGVLDAQTATTVELGTRGGTARLGWDAAVYHAWLDDEILVVELPPLPSGEFATSNADETTHAGVELGLESLLPLAESLAGDMRLRATYTYNRFRFDGDPAFGDNQIPGIPRHFGRLEALYEHASGFYIGPHVQAASDYFVDYANTLEADSFVIVGARAGYEHADRWSVFIEGQNLSDRAYISNTSTVADAGGEDAELFNPATERSVLAGLELNW